VARKSSASARPHKAVLRALGTQLRRLRLERGLSQEALAELSDLNYKHIGKIELGKSDPGADVLVSLARGLRVPVGELFATITPTGPNGSPVSPVDIQNVRAALDELTSVLDRLLTGDKGPLPLRAPRRPRR
jgi:transcriptional regulator with XRE-family HTH domain